MKLNSSMGLIPASPKAQYRLCMIPIGWTVALVIALALWAFFLDMRSGFKVLLGGIPIIIVEMMWRSSLSTRLEQRRKSVLGPLSAKRRK